MQTTEVLERLGYPGSPNFLPARDGAVAGAPGYMHLFSVAAKGPCHLKGVYTLRHPSSASAASVVPVVYVCEAKTEVAAREIHRHVWNQDVVPFVIVNTPSSIRLYSGFRYRQKGSNRAKGLLGALEGADQAMRALSEFRADSIDSGELWQRWGGEGGPSKPGPPEPP